VRVLHVINSLAGGGAERLVTQLLPRLRERKIEVQLLVLSGLDDERAAQLARAGVRVYCSQRRLYSPLQVFAIARLMRSVEVVHAHLFPSLLWVAIAARLCRVRAIYTEHSTNNRRRQHGLLRLVDALAYRQYTKIVCISQGVKEQLVDYLRATEAKSEIVYNGIDLRRFPEVQPGQEQWIVCVANLLEYKGQDVLIQAMPLLPDKTQLALAGRGPLEAELRELARSSGVMERIRFLGYVEDIATVYRRARICVIPSLWEGFGMVAVEAMASGVPEVVGEAGLLFDAGNPADLADKVSTLLKSPTLWNEKRRLGIERSRRFSIERMADEYCRIYAHAHD
jgi:glycosyltransferase involved in cell wall biosynthesis